MKRFYFFPALLVVSLLWSSALRAEDKSAYLFQRNELRIGWGDQLFESLVWHNPTSVTTTMPAANTYNYKERYRHHQHIWLEYQYRFTHWFSLGGMFDVSEVGWDRVTRNGQGVELARDKNNYFYNLVIMPTVRFTYFHHPNVNIYSGLGAGLDINGGTEVDGKGRHTACGAAVNLTLVGVSANYQRWFWAFDYGGMYALKNANAIYMLKSRMLNFSFGARF
ncbi:MAG: hypothetical protein IJ814_03100 [Paludibacteraceae bacterium]|nr:hypothetical protein [Paludibacteraceae bacterium]